MNEVFIRHLERASEIVSTWPEWKQNLLGRRTMNQVDQAARRAAEKTANPSCNASGCCCEKSIETHQRIIAAEFAPLLAEACGLLERVKPYMFGYGIELDCNKLNQRVSILDDIDKFLAAKEIGNG